MELLVRDAENLTLLLRLAEEEAEGLRGDLADIERARISTQNACEMLDGEAQKVQITAVGSGVGIAARESDSLNARRRSLQIALETLRRAEGDALTRFRATTGEISKLKRLIEVGVHAITEDGAGKTPISAEDIFKAGAVNG